MLSQSKPEFYLPVLMRAVSLISLWYYKSPHYSLPRVTLWNRKEVNPRVLHVYPLIIHMRALQGSKSPLITGWPSFTPETEHRRQVLRKAMPPKMHLHTLKYSLNHSTDASSKTGAISKCVIPAKGLYSCYRQTSYGKALQTHPF